MFERNFLEISEHLRQTQQQLCVGLDANKKRIAALGENYSGLERELKTYSKELRTDTDYVMAYNRMTILATAGIAGAYKPNWAFALEHGPRSFEILQDAVETIKNNCNPLTMRILDMKIGDIGSTNEGYGVFAFDWLHFDAITIHSYTGADAMKVLTDRKDKGFIAMGKNSNPGTEDTQDILVTYQTPDDEECTTPYFMHISDLVAHDWNTDKTKLNIGLVAGATRPSEAGMIRRLVGPNIFMLLPGIGDQGGTPEGIVSYALKKGESGLISASRSIAFGQRNYNESQAESIKRGALDLQNRMVITQNKLVA